MRRNWSKWGLIYTKNRSRLGRKRAEQMFLLMELLGLDEEGAEQLTLSRERRIGDAHLCVWLGSLHTHS